MNAWLTANWRWVLAAVIWLVFCAGVLVYLAGTRRGRTESQYSPDELRRVRELARDDTH